MSLLGRELQSGLCRREELCEGHLENGIGKHVTHKNPWLCILMSGSGRPRMHPLAMSSSQDLFVHISSLGKRKGALASQGRLLFHSLQYIVDKLPRVVIIENVRGLTFKRNAALLAHVKDCLQALHYSIHIRILCTSQSAVPQSRGRCYVVGIRGPKVGFKWPKVLTTVGLKHFWTAISSRRSTVEQPTENTNFCVSCRRNTRADWRRVGIASMLALP